MSFLIANQLQKYFLLNLIFFLIKTTHIPGTKMKKKKKKENENHKQQSGAKATLTETDGGHRS